MGRGPLRPAGHPLHRDLPHGRDGVDRPPRCCAGLGYWFFYGSDKLGPWIEPSVDLHHERRWCSSLSYAMPDRGHRGRRARPLALPGLFFIAIVVVGALMAVGVAPVGRTRRWSARSSRRSPAPTPGCRCAARPGPCRSSPSASPLFLGGGGVGRRAPPPPPDACRSRALAAARARAPTCPRCGPARWSPRTSQRPEDIPAVLAGRRRRTSTPRAHDTRVLEVPGSDFASYRWGNTVDPVTPGLIDRGYVARELFQYGHRPVGRTCSTPSTAASRRATIDPRPIAPDRPGDGRGRRRRSAADLQYERFRTPRPRDMWDVLLATRRGSARRCAFGAPDAQRRRARAAPDRRDRARRRPDAVTDPPPVAVFPVQNPVPIVRTHAADRPAAGGRRRRGPGRRRRRRPPRSPTRRSFYSALLRGRPDAASRRDLRPATPTSLRHRHQPPAGRAVGHDPREQSATPSGPARSPPLRPDDQRLEVFPDADDEADNRQRAARRRDGDAPRPTATRSPTRPTTGRPTPSTAIRQLRGGSAPSTTRSASGSIDRPRPPDVTTDHLHAAAADQTLRATAGSPRPGCTSTTGPPVDVDLDDDVTGGAGPDRHVPEQHVPPPEIEILRHEHRPAAPLRRLQRRRLRRGRHRRRPAGRRADPPADRPAGLGRRLARSTIAWRSLFTRLRSNPAEPVRPTRRPRIRRVFDLPTARRSRCSAQARLSAYVPDDADRPAARDPRCGARRDHRVVADPPVGQPRAAGLGRHRRRPDHVLGDGRSPNSTGQHIDTPSRSPPPSTTSTCSSWPTGATRCRPRCCSSARRRPGPGRRRADARTCPISDAERDGELRRVDFPQAGHRLELRVHVDRRPRGQDARLVHGDPITMPGRHRRARHPRRARRHPSRPPSTAGAAPTCSPSTARPVPLRVIGLDRTMRCNAQARRRALRRRPERDREPRRRRARACAPAIGRDLGIDLDQLSCSSSDAGGAPGPDHRRPTTEQPGRSPGDRTLNDAAGVATTPTSTDGPPFWLAVGQSWSDGWRATVDGKTSAPPQVIDGYGNGWLIDPAHGRHRRTSTSTGCPSGSCGSASASVGARRRRLPARPGVRLAAPAAPAESERVPHRGRRPAAGPTPAAGGRTVPMRRAAVARRRPRRSSCSSTCRCTGLLPAGRSGGRPGDLPGVPLVAGPGLARLGRRRLPGSAPRSTSSRRRSGTTTSPTSSGPQQFTRVHVLGLLAIFLASPRAIRAVAGEPPDTPRHPEIEASRADGRA